VSYSFLTYRIDSFSFNFKPKALLDFTGFEASKVLEAATKICVKVRAITVTVSRRELVAVKRKYDENRYVHVSSKFEEPDMQHITAAYEY
jgi:hypothetical protein